MRKIVMKHMKSFFIVGTLIFICNLCDYPFVFNYNTKYNKY